MSSEVYLGLTDAGGRGAVLAHKYSFSPHVRKIIAVPGNPLMALNLREGVAFEQAPGKLSAATAHAVADLLVARGASFVDVCQDDMVAGGAVNRLRELGIPVLGPTREAGRIEWDKAWARLFMEKYDIPHPRFRICTSEGEGVAYLNGQPEQRWAVKASGLAQGKGVIIAASSAEAKGALQKMKEFGEAGNVFLLEEYLEGEEFSTYAMSDGEDYQIIGSAQDHKRVFDADRGPNTGGMGCVSSPLVVTPAIEQQVSDILKKIFEGLRTEGHPYTGVLYLGGMVVQGKVFVIEVNARWGDPEAQVILPGLQTDLLEVAEAAITKRIRHLQLQFDRQVHVAVALASKGYPGDYSAVRGKEITGIRGASCRKGITIYGAGVKESDGRFYADGGRLLYVVGSGSDVIEARDKAYGALEDIRVEGGNGHYRTDIGSRDVARLVP